MKKIKKLQPDLPAHIVAKLKAQKKLVEKHSGDWINRSPQDSAKSFYRQIEADNNTHILAPENHSWIKEKVDPDNDEKIPMDHLVWVKGLPRVVKDEMDDGEVYRGRTKDDLRQMAISYTNGVVMSVMPEKVEKDFRDRIERAKENPSIGTLQSIHFPMMSEKQKIVCEENPHTVVQNNLTMFFSEIIEELEISDRQKKLLEEMAETYRSEKKSADKRMFNRSQVAVAKDRVYSITLFKSLNQGTFGDKRIRDLWEHNQKHLAEDLQEALENDNLKKASKLQRLRTSLKTLFEMSESQKYHISNIDPVASDNSGNTPSKAESLFSDQKSFVTTFQRLDEYLINSKWDVTFNYAQAIPELFAEDIPVDGVDDRIKKTELRHIKGSWSKNKLEKRPAKAHKVKAAELIHETKGERIQRVSYKDDPLRSDLWWGATHGRDFDCNIQQVIGANRYNPISIITDHLKFFHTFPDPELIKYNQDENKIKILGHRNEQGTMAGYEDEKLDLIYKHQTIGELLDALERMRNQDKDNKILEKYGYIPKEAKNQFAKVKTYEKFTDYFHEKLLYEIEGDIPEMPYTGNRHKMPSGFWKNPEDGLRRSKNREEQILNMDLPKGRKEIADDLGLTKRQIKNVAEKAPNLRYWQVNGVGSGVEKRKIYDLSLVFG